MPRQSPASAPPANAYDRCYIETHDENYIGHFRLRHITFTQEKLAIELDRAKDNLICITFTMAASDFEEASRVIKIIGGERSAFGEHRSFPVPSI